MEIRAIRSFTERVVIESVGTSNSPDSPDSPDKRESRLSIDYRRVSRVIINCLVDSILDKLDTSVKTTRAFPLLYKLEDIVVRIGNK